MTRSNAVLPRIGVVTVNYDGGAMTLRCIESLRATEWPADRLDIVLVDNASRDGVIAEVHERWPEVTIARSEVNLGFAGGANLGIRGLAEVDHVALVNNDVTVSRDWLAPLVHVLESDPSIGAACPKILFTGRFVEVDIRSPTQHRRRGDRRDLGVRVSGVEVDGEDLWRRSQLVDGFWGPEIGRGDEREYQWTSADARLRVPVEATTSSTEVRVRLAADHPTTVRLSSGDTSVALDVDTSPAWHALPLRGEPIDVVNNAGGELDADDYGIDRCWLEPDNGRADDPQDVFAWCGAAVLLSRAYLDDVGDFDDRLFLYYEDLELSWRGQERGWRYRYEPASVVRHLHSATSVENSRLARYQNERNRLLVLARHTDLPRLASAVWRYALVTASYTRRDLVSPLLRGSPPSTAIVAGRSQAFFGFLRRLPAMRRSHRDDTARSRTADALPGQPGRA